MGAQRQSAAGGKIERARLAPDFGQYAGKTPATKGFLEDPEGFGRTPGAYDHDFSRIEAEAIKTGAIGMARFAEGTGFADQQERAVIEARETGQESDGEAGGDDGIASGFAAHLMQCIAAKAAAKQAVERPDAEGQKWPVDRQRSWPALDFGDPPPQPGKGIPCHGNACAYGHPTGPQINVLALFY